MSNSPEFSWASYFDFARALSKRPEADEAVLRSVISRAYYAAYHAARELLEAKGHTLPQNNVHSAVWAKCQHQGGIELKPIGRKGFGLRDDRVKADYDNPFPEQLKPKVQFALKTAEFILTEVTKIREAMIRGGQ